MKNIKATVNGTILTLEVDLSKRGEKSASGKSLQVASTEGNISVEGYPDVKMGVNIYVPVSKA